jgi:AraC family transcriptional regulator, transcriptional activator of pobA
MIINYLNKPIFTIFMDTIFRTLQDFFKSINLPLQQDFEMTVHPLKGLHGAGKKQSPLFRTDYFSFLLITKGQSSYTIDKQEFELGKNSFYFTLPGHLKSFNIQKPLEGYLVTFTETFFKQNYNGDFFQIFPFLLNESTPVMKLSDELVNWLSQLLETMLVEYKGSSTFKQQILFNQLSILLLKTKELLQSHQVNIKASNRSMELVNKFKTILNNNFIALITGKIDKIFSIKEMANSIHVHPNYLTNVVKDETGKSASDWIQDRTIAETQSMLKNSTKTISEIAHLFGFTDGTHFAKFFKKLCGSSPSEYRKSVNL